MEELKNKIIVNFKIDITIPFGQQVPCFDPEIVTLRKMVTDVINRFLYKKFNPTMNVVPCETHITEKCINFENNLFGSKNINDYTDVKIIKILADESFNELFKQID